MKKMTVAIVALVLLAASGTFFWQQSRVQAMSIQVHVKDFPEYGIRIISSSDPSFDQKVQPFFTGQPQTIVDRVKPFSVILENLGQLAVVGSTIKWEILRRDGTTFTYPISSVNTRALMDGEPKHIQTTAAAALPSRATRFISVLGSAREGEQVDLSRSWMAFRGSSTEREEFMQALSQGDLKKAFNLSAIGKVLSEAISVTVSVDLIFFEDGTFVGDDKSDFFNKVKADIDAQYDLAKEVALAQDIGKTPNEILKEMSEGASASPETKTASPQIDRLGRKPEFDGSVESTIQRYSNEYNRSKKLYVQQFMAQGNALGAKEAISQTVKLLDKPRKELRKR